MNFWRYTFRGKFIFYAATTLLVAIVAMLTLHYTGSDEKITITIFLTWLILLFVSIAGSYYRWVEYRNNFGKGLWGDRTRLN